MTNRGVRPRFESEIAPSEELFSRIRAPVAAPPASKASTRLRVTVAMALVPLLTAAVLLVASHIVYERPVLRVHMGTPVTSELLIVLLLIVALTLSATRIALGRGEGGLGSGVTSLFLVAVLVTQLYAVLTLMDPMSVNYT